MKKNDYVIVITETAGVFAGKLKEIYKTTRTVSLKDARRIWYWTGAASLSQLAVSGTVMPEKCQFPAPVEECLLFEIIEILICTKKASKSIQSVPVWEIKENENDDKE